MPVLSHSVASKSLQFPYTVAGQAPRSIGIFQARILERVAIYSSRGSSLFRDQTLISFIGRWILYNGATWEAPSFCIIVHKSLIRTSSRQIFKQNNYTKHLPLTYHAVLSAAVTIFYIRSSDLTYLTNLFLFPHLPHQTPGKHFSLFL